MQGQASKLIEQVPSTFVGGPTKFRSRRVFAYASSGPFAMSSPPADLSRRKSKGRAGRRHRMDLATWRAIDAGDLSGYRGLRGRAISSAAASRNYVVRAPLRRSHGEGFRYNLERVSLGGIEMSALVAGSGRATPLAHPRARSDEGVVASRGPALAENHRVYAIDLPGFGASSKPRGAYNAPWFAEHVFRFLDMVGEKKAFVAGNSLGGRVAIEMAMKEPERVSGIACLCPAAAFTHRPRLASFKCCARTRARRECFRGATQEEPSGPLLRPETYQRGLVRGRDRRLPAIWKGSCPFGVLHALRNVI